MATQVTRGSWDAFAEAMTDRYRVLALDQRGHGETSWAAADQYGVDDMADDLEVFARALDLRSFTLLGLSMGGMVVMEYAGRRSKPLIARLDVVANAGHGVPLDAPEGFLAATREFLKG